MSDLEALFEAIDQLPPDELEQVQRHIVQRLTGKQPISKENVEARIAALHKATENFWEGFTETQVEDIVTVMNSEYIDPEDPGLFAWVDDLPEDER